MSQDLIPSETVDKDPVSLPSGTLSVQGVLLKNLDFAEESLL